MSRRRLAALMAIVAVAAAAFVVAILYAGSSPEPALPDGGSGFSERRPGLGYLDRPTASSNDGPAPGITLERGAAQLFVVGFAGKSRFSRFWVQLRRRGWGGVLLTPGNGTAITAHIRGVARRARHRAPLIVAAPGLPGMPRRGHASPPSARSSAAAAARRLRGRGVTMALAPAVDVGYAGGPYARAAFSSDPIVVARSARAAVDGWRAGGVAPVASSYPGTGAASANPAEAVATVGLSIDELRARDTSIFQGLNGRVPVVQMSAALYAAFDGVTPATLLPEAVAMLRRDRFRGVVMSASLPATTLATGGSVAEAAVAALRAGCDLLLVPGDARDQEAAYRAVVRAIRKGDVSQSRYRDALARVTALKRAYRVR